MSCFITLITLFYFHTPLCHCFYNISVWRLEKVSLVMAIGCLCSRLGEKMFCGVYKLREKGQLC